MQHSESAVAGKIGRILSDRGSSISAAESCTGGMVSAILTSVPGSSGWFRGSVIAYSNNVKMKLLHVSPKTLESYGAVSEETVSEMARGVMETTGTEFSLAITGIAGPGGGSLTKPVGTVWMAVCKEGSVIAWMRVFEGDRSHIREAASMCILKELLNRLEGEVL